MKIRLYKLLLLLLMPGYWVTVQAQTHEIDSIRKSVLKSVQKELEEEGISKSYFDTATIFSKENREDLSEAFDVLNKGLLIAKSAGDINTLQKGYYKLSTLDSVRGNYKGAYEHYKLYSLFRDSLQKEETEKRALQAKMQYEFDKKQAVAKAEQDKKDAEQRRIKNLQYFTIAGLMVLLIAISMIVFIQWKNNNQKKKTNASLQQQKEKVESALTELKSTQAQLIQSEKMASLGELTAGIAHEIQNPLNFVNNFSDINSELLEELKDEAKKGNLSEVEAIANDVIENEQKINHHGKRADAIVKGMLQHSRQTKGIKEPTDINAFCDEYLRLSYHGLRAKDKNFNADFKTDFDESIGKINVVPQDIGRVLLNLFNNAFYAVKPPNPLKGEHYKPLVTVTTRKVGSPLGAGGIEIIVHDNGNGIPQNIIDKIFQPFFTTKPTGEGTGLGLSLSYDIIKAHEGELKVESKEGEGSVFTINLCV